MRFLKINIFLIWIILIVVGIRGYIYYQHDKAVARTERGNLELGFQNISETNINVMEYVGKIKNNVRFMIEHQDLEISRLAANDAAFENILRATHYEFEHLWKILDDIIGLERNKKKKRLDNPQ